MAQITLNGNQFHELLCRMFEKHLGSRDLKKILEKDRSKVFGYGIYDPDGEKINEPNNEIKEQKIESARKESLKNALINDIKVKNYLNAKNLKTNDIKLKPLHDKYTKYESLKVPAEGTFGIREPLIKVCFEYIEIKEREELSTDSFQSRNSSSSSIKGGLTTTVTPNVSEKKELKTQDFRYFLGVYFSIKSFSIKSFFLNISKESSEDGTYQVFEKGFHTVGRETKEVEYEGTMEKTKEGYCFATLVKKRGNKRKLNLAWYIENGWEDTKYFRGSIQGVSKSNHFLNVECIFIPLDNQQWKILSENKRDLSGAKVLEDEEYYNLCFYLAMQRRIFRSTREKITDLLNMKSKGKEINAFSKNLSGVYRIWQLTLTKGNILQSCMVIKNDGLAYLDTVIKDSISGKSYKRRFNCVLNVTVEDHKLCIDSFFPNTYKIANYAILDFANYQDTGFIEGIFSSAGNKKGIIGGYMLWKKEREYTEGIENQSYVKQFGVGDKTRADIAELIKQDESLGAFYSALLELWRSKLWKKNRRK